MSRASKPLLVLNAPLSLAFARQLPPMGELLPYFTVQYKTSPIDRLPRPGEVAR